MWCGAGPLAVVAAVFWTQCVLLDGVEAKKERKRPKEAIPPQHTETFNTTLSNSEEVGGSIKVVTKSLLKFVIFVTILHVEKQSCSLKFEVNLQMCKTIYTGRVKVKAKTGQVCPSRSSLRQGDRPKCVKP